MHGRQRSEYKAMQRDPVVAANLAAKAEKWHALSREIAARRAAAPQDETSLALTEKMLLVNPDPMYLWNYRRELLLADNTTSSNSVLLDTELRVTQSALQNNPKSYGAWFHRKWALLSLLKDDDDNCDTTSSSVHASELDLTAAFLQRDERNFHCWNYRRFVVSCMLQGSDATDGNHNNWWKSPQVGGREAEAKTVPVTDNAKKNDILQAEWEFTSSKIQDNFSNFSAFHYRSKLLPWKLEQIGSIAIGKSKQEVISEEWELVSNAIFTEPDDQTSWWYAQFLLDSKHVFCSDDESWYEELLGQQVEQVRELLVEMPQSKWVCLGLYELLSSAITTSGNLNEREELLQKLIELDPDRRGRYEYLLKKQQQ